VENRFRSSTTAHASEFLAQLLLVAKKNALMICGPAIMTNASGMISAKLIERSSRACPG